MYGPKLLCGSNPALRNLKPRLKKYLVEKKMLNKNVLKCYIFLLEPPKKDVTGSRRSLKPYRELFKHKIPSLLLFLGQF
jgi:hypothetical protein